MLGKRISVSIKKKTKRIIIIETQKHGRKTNLEPFSKNVEAVKSRINLRTQNETKKGNVYFLKVWNYNGKALLSIVRKQRNFTLDFGKQTAAIDLSWILGLHLQTFFTFRKMKQVTNWFEWTNHPD